MKTFTARTPEQLDLCLRMLYGEQIEFTVKFKKDSHGKLQYAVGADVDDAAYEKLNRRYQTLIS